MMPVSEFRGLMDEVFAAAEADFEPDRLAVEARRKVERKAVGVVLPADRSGGEGVEVGVEVAFLGVAQTLAAQSAVEVAPRFAGGGGVVAHAQVDAQTGGKGQALRARNPPAPDTARWRA